MLAKFDGSFIPLSALLDAGISLTELPPNTPIEVRLDENGNEVIITAEVAISLQLVSNPAELFGALFTNPTAAFTAIGNVGADMSEEERVEAKKMVLATVVAAGAALNSLAAATRGAGNTNGGSNQSQRTRGAYLHKPKRKRRERQ